MKIQINQEKIRELLKETCRDYDIPGAVVAVFRSDTILAEISHGVKRMNTSRRIELDDNFHLGSNTKAFTASMIASLVEDGLLSWSTKPCDVFLEFSSEIHPGYKEITLKDLLNHTAGIQPFTDGMELEEIPEYAVSPKIERYLFSQLILKKKPFFQPGELNYSNAGYSIAAAKAETVSDKSWEELVTERIFNQLGIKAKFGWPNSIDENQPWGHGYKVPRGSKWDEIADGELITYPPDHSYHVHQLLAPAGDIQLNLEDFIKFCQFNLKGLRGEETVSESGKSILQIDSFKTLHEDHKGYGLGWGIVSFDDRFISAHSGCAGTFYSSILVYPHVDYGIILLANAGHAKAAEGGMKLVQALFDLYLKDM